MCFSSLTQEFRGKKLGVKLWMPKTVAELPGACVGGPEFKTESAKNNEQEAERSNNSMSLLEAC